MNWEQIRQDMEGGLADMLTGLLEGAREDVAKFAQPIAFDIMRAAQLNDVGRFDELKGQLEALAEINRLRAANGSWALVQGALEGLFTVVIGVLGVAYRGQP